MPRTWLRSPAPRAPPCAWTSSAPLPPLDPQPHGHRLGTIGRAELLVDRPDVVLDRLLADHELLRDVAIRAAAADEAHHLALALGQGIGTRFAPRRGHAVLAAGDELEDHGGHRRRDD